MRGFLTILKANGEAGASFAIVKAKCVIGREESCLIRILIQSVAERHCLIRASINKPAVVKSLCISSPVLLNGKPVYRSEKLDHLDVITIEGRRFRWEYPSTSVFHRDTRAGEGLSKHMAGMVEIPFSAKPKLKKNAARLPKVASTSKVQNRKAARTSEPAVGRKLPIGKPLLKSRANQKPKKLTVSAPLVIPKTATAAARLTTPKSKTPRTIRKTPKPGKTGTTPKPVLSLVSKKIQKTPKSALATRSTTKPKSKRKVTFYSGVVTPVKTTKDIVFKPTPFRPHLSMENMTSSHTNIQSEQIMTAVGLKKNLDTAEAKAEIAAKILKQESPVLDKKKNAALMLCHGRRAKSVPAKMSNPIYKVQQADLLNGRFLQRNNPFLSNKIQASMNKPAKNLDALLQRRSTFKPAIETSPSTSREVFPVLTTGTEVVGTRKRKMKAVKRQIEFPSTTSYTGIKDLFSRPATPDYTNVIGVKRMYGSASNKSNYLDVTGIRTLFMDTSPASSSTSQSTATGLLFQSNVASQSSSILKKTEAPLPNSARSAGSTKTKSVRREAVTKTKVQTRKPSSSPKTDLRRSGSSISAGVKRRRVPAVKESTKSSTLKKTEVALRSSSRPAGPTKIKRVRMETLTKSKVETTKPKKKSFLPKTEGGRSGSRSSAGLAGKKRKRRQTIKDEESTASSLLLKTGGSSNSVGPTRAKRAKGDSVAKSELKTGKQKNTSGLPKTAVASSSPSPVRGTMITRSKIKSAEQSSDKIKKPKNSSGLPKTAVASSSPSPVRGTMITRSKIKSAEQSSDKIKKPKNSSPSGQSRVLRSGVKTGARRPVGRPSKSKGKECCA